MMNPTTQWWLTHTAAGRRTLERMVPASAIPRSVREQMCAERGHSLLGDGSCARCGTQVNDKPNRRKR